ncbi:MAG: AAA family ATPase, partial [Ruminococcus sp.]|nr:AAA family ATPase [Ruminococcus sp.]
MLREIYIKNLAVIKEAVIPLTEKLNIFTGETGAGKSILINGINAVLGHRCSKDIVRTGCDKAIITALFTELDGDIIKHLDELGIAHENDEITVTREIGSDGRSIARINHRTASASLLKEIGAMLINIHGQHDNQVLMDSERHLQVLDDFGTDCTFLENYREAFRELQQTAKKLNELRKFEQSRTERTVYLNAIIEDIGELELSENEDETLQKEYETAKNAEKMIIAIKNAVQTLTGEDTANDMITSAEFEISRYTTNNEELNTLYEILSAGEIELEDIS